MTTASAALREAVIQANQAPGPATIVFAPGLTGTITLTSGQMQISGSDDDRRPGRGQAHDRRQRERSHFLDLRDRSGVSRDRRPGLPRVPISGLTLTNARNTFANTGGAIFTEHSLALDSVVVQNNCVATGSGRRVLVQYPGQTLTITNSQFVNNLAMPIAVTGSHDVVESERRRARDHRAVRGLPECVPFVRRR